MLLRALIALGAATLISAQRPSNTSLCDYYTTALLHDNNATNQYTLLTLVVNTAVIGNYTQPNVGVSVPGILAPGSYNGTPVNLLPYFDGGLASSNRGGSSGVAINFLDDGGAAPIKMSKPSNGDTSNQFNLLTHLYQFFGILLGCSQYADPGFPAYAGFPGMYQVHKFMSLTPSQVGYFITQVSASAASFGVAPDDVITITAALTSAFDNRCGPPAAIVPDQPAMQQSICVADSCPLSPSNASCAAYMAPVVPAVANASLAMGEGNSSSSATAANSTMGNGGGGGGGNVTSGASSSSSGSGASPTSSSQPPPAPKKSQAASGAGGGVGAVTRGSMAALAGAVWAVGFVS